MLSGHTQTFKAAHVNFSTADPYTDNQIKSQGNLHGNEKKVQSVTSPNRRRPDESELSSSRLQNSSSQRQFVKSSRKTPTRSGLSKERSKGRESSTPQRKKDVSWGKSPTSSQRKGKSSQGHSNKKRGQSPKANEEKPFSILDIINKHQKQYMD